MRFNFKKILKLKSAINGRLAPVDNFLGDSDVSTVGHLSGTS